MPRKGYKATKEHKNRIRKAHVGEGGASWRGGHIGWYTLKAKIRDNYTCQICGLRDEEIVEVDHIKPKKKFPKLSKVLENMITLCPNCHARKTKRERKSGLYNSRIS